MNNTVGEYMNIGTNIKKIRKEKSWNAERLAKLVGISPQAIYQYERGERIPNAIFIYKISEALNVTVQELMTGNKQKVKLIEKDITHFSTEELLKELYRRTIK